ncbi:MAG: hypothetical protein Q9224_006500, partial [Gallowayella concinna]
YLTLHAGYNYYLHPLSNHPGPPLWAISRLPYVRAMQRGNLVGRIAEIHSKYGPIVRVAPNELSFTDAMACHDIYAARGGQPKFPKNPIWMGESPPRASSIVSANDTDHARIRGVWAHAFSERALREQEPVMQHYIDRFLVQLRGLDNTHGLDIVQWFNYWTFDLTGDLAFGESFGCLDGQELHPWISMIFSHFKSATLLASIGFYPRLHGMLIWFLPAAVLRKQQEHFRFSRQKVQRRVNLEKERPDFLHHVLKHNQGENALTETEIEKTAATMIVAGSETTGTLLSGIMSHLIQYPAVMDNVVREIRSTYNTESEISMTNVAQLPYLQAVIQETLRIAPPVPTGMPRVVPAGGATVCGLWLPENVSKPNFTCCWKSRVIFVPP